MKIFDTEEPPNSYKKFKREVLHTLEETSVSEDDEEGFPSALFVVNREEEGFIYYLKDLVDEDELDDDEEFDLGFLIGVALPHIVKYENSKYFAFVFSGEKSGLKEEAQVLVVLSGSMYETDMVYSEYDFEEGQAVLEPWEKDQIMQYPDLVAPFRRAITPQG